MRIKGIRKTIAITAAVSCLMGTGAFTTIRGEENLLQPESENAVIDTENSMDETESSVEPVRISWWISPIGGYSDEEKVQELVDAFEKEHPEIEVDFRILDEKTGADEIDMALNGKDSSDAAAMPDVVLAAPEDIVTKWGSEGHMADLAQLWDEETVSEFRSEMRDVSKNREGTWYAVPLFRDLYTMAINYDMFEKAGALQYLSEAAHSWKDSGFIDSVLRVHDVLVQEKESEEAAASGENDSKDTSEEKSGKEDESADDVGIVGKVYCKDQNAQRAFMSFVSNFFNTGLVDDYRSSYQVGSSEIRNVFGTLRKLVGKGIEFDPEMDGDDENEAFLNGDLFLTFNWSAAKQRAAGPDAQVSVDSFGWMTTDNNPAEELYGGTKEESKDDTKAGLNEENPEEAKAESKGDLNEENPEDAKTESKEDLNEENPEDAKAESKGALNEENPENAKEEPKEDAEDGPGFRIFPMMYPNSKNTPTLTGPVRALGVAETEDEKKKDAAMSFVQFLMSDEDAYRKAVLTADCFPARRSINGHDLTGLYGDDEVMQLYETLNEYYEDYDPTMELYPQLEEAWPQLLREIGDDAKIKSVTVDLEEDLNETLEDEYGIKKIEMEE